MASPEDFYKASPETLTEILREAESHLSAQLTAALASNSRAMSFTGFLAAVTVLLIGFAGGSLLENERIELASVAGALAIGFLIAMALAMKAAAPARFWYAGNSPEQWVEDIASKKLVTHSKAEQLAHYASMISDNSECMERSNDALKQAMRVCWVSIIAAGIMIVCMWQYSRM